MFQLTEEEKAKVVANCDHLKRLKFPLSFISPYFTFATHSKITIFIFYFGANNEHC